MKKATAEKKILVTKTLLKQEVDRVREEVKWNVFIVKAKWSKEMLHLA